jgi:hypothetical protein
MERRLSPPLAPRRRLLMTLSNVFRFHNVRTVAVLAVILFFPGFAQTGRADDSSDISEAIQKLINNPTLNLKGTATLPIIFCWFKGQPALYIQTDASDPTVALQQGVNNVPILSNAINANPGAVDDIYVVTNYKQGNVIPSAPIPAGPANTNPNYSPLWQVSTVTWKAGATTPHTLKSEEEVLAAARAGFVTLTKTNIVVNCPVVFTPSGGQLPTVKIRIEE